MLIPPIERKQSAFAANDRIFQFGRMLFVVINKYVISQKTGNLIW